MAKVDQTKANMLLSATKTLSLGANTNSIRILYGSHVAENIDFRSEPQQNVKKGIRGWSRRSDNRRAFSAVIDVAVNYFGFDPIHGTGLGDRARPVRRVGGNRALLPENVPGWCPG